MRRVNRASIVASASVISCGEAEATSMATGKLEPSQIAIILLPFPRFVFPTHDPLFWRLQRCRQCSILLYPLSHSVPSVVPILAGSSETFSAAPTPEISDDRSGRTGIVWGVLPTGRRCAVPTRFRSIRPDPACASFLCSPCGAAGTEAEV